jgi:hypothetical protein
MAETLAEMQTSSLALSHESTIDLAKSALQQHACEWGDCQVVLNSWFQLEKVRE